MKRHFRGYSDTNAMVLPSFLMSQNYKMAAAFNQLQKVILTLSLRTAAGVCSDPAKMRIHWLRVYSFFCYN
jgi:hypothetical protein